MKASGIENNDVSVVFLLLVDVLLLTRKYLICVRSPALPGAQINASF